jgi:hypothetical protein
MLLHLLTTGIGTHSPLWSVGAHVRLQYYFPRAGLAAGRLLMTLAV